MRSELANLNHCAVPFLSRAAVNLSWFNYSRVAYIYVRSRAKYLKFRTTTSKINILGNL